jgi:hypothetical protein
MRDGFFCRLLAHCLPLVVSLGIREVGVELSRLDRVGGLLVCSLCASSLCRAVCDTTGWMCTYARGLLCRVPGLVMIRVSQ